MQRRRNKYQRNTQALGAHISNDAAHNANDCRNQQNIALAMFGEHLGGKRHHDHCGENGDDGDQRIHIRIAKHITGKEHSCGKENAVDDEARNKNQNGNVKIFCGQQLFYPLFDVMRVPLPVFGVCTNCHLFTCTQIADSLKDQAKDAEYQGNACPGCLHLFTASRCQKLGREDRQQQPGDERKNAAQRTDLVSVLAGKADAGQHGMIGHVVDRIDNDGQYEVGNNDPRHFG